MAIANHFLSDKIDQRKHGGKELGAKTSTTRPDAKPAAAAPKTSRPSVSNLVRGVPKDRAGEDATRYGQNGFGGASSVLVQDSVALADNIDIAPPGGDPELARIQSGADRKNIQQGGPSANAPRSLGDAGKVGAHRAMKADPNASGAPGGKVPDGIGRDAWHSPSYPKP